MLITPYAVSTVGEIVSFVSQRPESPNVLTLFYMETYCKRRAKKS